MKTHQLDECPMGKQECSKCHGIYNATDDHCCISHLYKLIQTVKENQSNDRDQINQGF